MSKEDRKNIEKLVTSPFEKRPLDSAFMNLDDTSNELRLNNFAYSIRELSRHVLKSLAPDKDVEDCSWYRNNSGEVGKITRGERIKYAVQGGLTDDFLDSEIMSLAELNKMKKEVLDSIRVLSKYTHINADTYDLSNSDIETTSSSIIKSFSEFKAAIDDSRNRIFSGLESKIDSEIIDHTLFNTYDEIDILSSHHNVESYSTSSIHVVNLCSGSIELEVYGDLDLRLQYGSNSDLKRGDGVELNTSFPFTSSMNVALNGDLDSSEIQITKFDVNTDDWYDQS